MIQKSKIRHPESQLRVVNSGIVDGHELGLDAIFGIYARVSLLLQQGLPCPRTIAYIVRPLIINPRFSVQKS
jgi:hypothetical protein